MYEFLMRQFRSLLWSDRPLFGFVRFFFVVVCPLLLPAMELLWVLLRKVYNLPSLTDIQQFIFGRFSPLIHELLLLYFLGLLGAFAAGVSYIKDIYDVDAERLPLWHLTSSFLGLFVPKIKVSNRMQETSGKEMVERIGGPARLSIEPGYAVLTETLTAPGNIYGPGKKQFISRKQRILEVIDLHEQAGKDAKVEATTRDGIGVTVEKIRFNFRLWDEQWDADPSTKTKILNPYPFSKDAIHKYVYSRTVSVDEQGEPKRFRWMEAMSGRVSAIVKNYISEHKLDEVIASREHTQKNPREIIRNKAYEPKLKKELRSMGTILRWWDPGEFSSLRDIENQFLSNWAVDIRSNIDLNHAHGNAQKQAYEELGRAEAEAELLMSIIHSLNGVKFAHEKPKTLQNLILIRTAQVIRALNTPAHDTASKDSDGKKQDTNLKT